VAYTYNLSTWKAEAGGLRVQDHPGLYSKTLSQKKKQIIWPHKEMKYQYTLHNMDET
jgi:hypothetical protein